MAEAAERCGRRTDTYVWAKAYILDAQCALGRVHSHQSTQRWIEELYDLVARTGMRDLQARAMLHRTAFGIDDQWEAAAHLAEEIGSPRLTAAVAAV